MFLVLMYGPKFSKKHPPKPLEIEEGVLVKVLS
jgi:hypothetical protein